MNKQFSPFLQRYFLIITEAICNQIRKYRGISKQIRSHLNALRSPKKPYEEVDEKIKPLVEALNTLTNVRTIASCEGHASWGNPPYVAFFAQEAVAAEIQSLLVDKHWRKLPPLSERWIIEASFNLDYKLLYCLHSKRYRQMSSSAFGQVLLTLHRNRIDRDIQILTQVIWTLSRTKIHV